MTQFSEGYTQLNDAQRAAVDTIDGPVLVIAGPGTGKTQLLSMRAATIVQRTDALPQNILCLTFTESAAANMRQRLIQLMGPEGNKVAVHTFHSFGADVINKFSEFFYNGARFTPADELAGYEILREIFGTLKHSNPLAKTMNEEFTALSDSQAAISHLKRAGLHPKELLNILDHNQAFFDYAEPIMGDFFAARLSKKDFPRAGEISHQLQAFEASPMPLDFIKPVHELCCHELQKALDDAEEQGKTTPLTAWRNRWLEKNTEGTFVFKDQKRTRKLRALAHIYEKYRTKLSERELFDFDDMVSLVAHTMEQNDDLRFNLQEQYLYIMVDEFQDTNGAQLRLLSALTDNPANEGRPNILAVGDDDQAIYSFQGAELSNILDFATRYTQPTIVTLTENYRSTDTILKASRKVVTQGQERLETTLKNVSKELSAHKKTTNTHTELHNFKTPESEYRWIAEQVQLLIKNGAKPNEIAVLARNHKYLLELLPHLHAARINVHYERRNNVLESTHIRELITLAEVVNAIAEQRFDVVESLLPELLSYPFWGLKTSDIWQLSLDAFKQHRMWLELMVEKDGPLHTIAEFLIVSAHKSTYEPLDTMLDILIGTNELQAPENGESEIDPSIQPGPIEQFISPYRAYYFNEQRLKENPEEYLTLLSNLRAIRRSLRDWRPDHILSLRSFIDFIELHERTNKPIMDTFEHRDAADSIHTMTAHKAKGLEFQTVFVLSCQDEIWGRKARRPSSSISFPYNLPIEPAGSSFDDALRLFFVAMTRAKQYLFLTSHSTASNGKEVLLAEFLQENFTAEQHNDTAETHIEQLAPGWHQRHLSLPKIKQEVLLQPFLEHYRLSATHVNNFLDVTRGGPQAFLLQNLLRFPQAITKGQVFGFAIHAVLNRAQTHLAATGDRRPVEDILHDYELHLQQCRLSERDFTYLYEKGSDILQAYIGERYGIMQPHHTSERDFAGQSVVLDNMRLTGAIDLMQIDDETKTITVVDYKTGKGFNKWRGVTDFDKIKLHKYKQQLLLYKLLVEHSRDYGGKYKVEHGVLEFVEADSNGTFHQLSLEYGDSELAQFTELLKVVWQHIMTLNLPDTSHYPPTYAGMLAFEQDLLSGKI